jgi:hypothetical protein
VKPRKQVEHWMVRNAWSGKLLGQVDSADIDEALSLGRMFFGYDVTVDNAGRTERDL